MLRDGLFYYRPDRPAGIAIAVVSFAVLAVLVAVAAQLEEAVCAGPGT